MTKFRLIAAAAIAGVFTMLSSGTAHAGYPDPAITITVDDADIIGGTTFSYKATSGSVDCDWTITYADGHAPGVPPTQTGSGTSISGSYKTKVVTSVFRSPITAKCVYDDGQVASTSDGSTGPAFFSTSSGAKTVQAIDQTASASATITLRPKGSDGDDNGALPDTGGSNLSLFLHGRRTGSRRRRSHLLGSPSSVEPLRLVRKVVHVPNFGACTTLYVDTCDHPFGVQ